MTHIPVGWNPSAVAFSPDSTTLYVVNTKGKGAGPNGGKDARSEGAIVRGFAGNGQPERDSAGILPPPDVLTQTVIAANTTDIADPPQLPKLKHCFFVIRENRTYDEVLGDVKRANGDPALARYGMDGWVTEEAPKAANVDTSAGVHEHKAARGGKKLRKRARNRDRDQIDGGAAAAPATAHLQVTPNLHALAEQFRDERQLLCGFRCVRRTGIGG